MADVRDPNEERALLDQLYAVVGTVDEGELVSESLVRERREAAAREAQDRE